MICHKRVEPFSQTRYQRFCRHWYCQGENERIRERDRTFHSPFSELFFDTHSSTPPLFACFLPSFSLAVPILVHWRKRGKSACIVTDSQLSALLSVWLRTSSSPHRLRTTHTLACPRSLLAFISCFLLLFFFFVGCTGITLATCTLLRHRKSFCSRIPSQFSPRTLLTVLIASKSCRFRIDTPSTRRRPLLHTPLTPNKLEGKSQLQICFRHSTTRINQGLLIPSMLAQRW